jgi:hypothetical protein
MMKTHRVLGVLWMALGGFLGIAFLWILSRTFIFHPQVLAAPRFYLLTLLCLLYLAGGVAGLFLYRGAPWARGFVGVIAVLIVTAGIAQTVSQGLPLLCGVVGVLAIFSVVLLFFPSKAIVVGTVVLLALGTATWIALQLDIPHRLTLAEGRRAIASHKAEPLDLTAQYDTLASNFGNEMTVVPRGFQTFAHVPLQIDGSKCLWGGGYPKFGEGIGAENLLDIPVHRKFETLYVCHTAIFWSPNNAPVYELVFRYDDDDYSVTNQIRYGVDVLDWYANKGKTVIGPAGPNSRLAWHGEYSANGKTIPLRFTLTALKNPKPFLEVASIDLYSCKSNSCGLILAMTTGQSGLMR